MNDSLSEQYASSLLYGGNGPYVEALYEQYLRDPGSVAPEWRTYFDRVRGTANDTAHGPILDSLRERARLGVASGSDQRHKANAKQGAVSRLIQVYANRGHLIARLDPLGLTKRPVPKVLELEYFGLSAADRGTLADRAMPYARNRFSREKLGEAIIEVYEGVLAEARA